MKFILFCKTLDLSDNLTEICIVKKLENPGDLEQVTGLHTISLGQIN